MKKCKFCKTEIEDDAKVCYSCQREQKSGNPIMIIFVVALILFVLIPNAKKLVVSFKKDVLKDVGLKENIPKNIGEELICKDYKVVVESYKYKTGDIDSYWEVPSGTEWIGIIATATNTSSDNIDVYSSNFSITNSNGEILRNDVISYDVWGNYDVFSGELAPNGTKTGYIAFSNTNKDNTNIKLKFDCDTFSSSAGSYVINLK
jgi:predicted nucleic acid-binding Zn ribbon protein